MYTEQHIQQCHVTKCFSLSYFGGTRPSILSDLPADNLLIQVLPEHLELSHWLLDGAAIGLLRHLLQQEACLVVQTLHLNL